MNGTSWIERIAEGAAAGFAGTAALQVVRTGSQQRLPETMAPLRQEPGRFMVEKASAALPVETRARLPEAGKKAAGQALGVGYGLTWGALYAALRPRGGSPWVEGAALGAGSWAAGYLGWLPALGLMPSVAEQAPRQVVGPLLRHLLFGIVTVAAYDKLRGRR